MSQVYSGTGWTICLGDRITIRPGTAYAPVELAKEETKTVRRAFGSDDEIRRRIAEIRAAAVRADP